MSSEYLYRNSDISVFSGEIITFFVKKNEVSDTNSLIIKIKDGTEEINLLTTDAKFYIYDFQVVESSSTEIKILWREKENVLFGRSTCHYGIISEDFKLSKNINFSEDNNYPEHFICLRGILLSEYIFTVCIDTVNKKVVASIFDSTNYTLAETPIALANDISENYLGNQQHILANVLLIKDTSENVYLQFILASGTLRVFSVAISPDEQALVTVDKLFDFAYEDIGYHHCIIDEDNKLMLVTYSGVKNQGEDNNIYVAMQQIFLAKDDAIGGLLRETQVINQSQGVYYRPDIIISSDNYLVAWEGINVHYTAFDSEFNITTPESVVDIEYPGNVLLLTNNYLSCQSENLANKDFGLGEVFVSI